MTTTAEKLRAIQAALQALIDNDEHDQEKLHLMRDILVLDALDLLAPDVAELARRCEREIKFWYA